jgi:hypothetical protein
LVHGAGEKKDAIPEPVAAYAANAAAANIRLLRESYREKCGGRGIDMLINTSREALTLALRSHGEDDCAGLVATLTDEQFRTIGERAGWYVLNAPSGRPGGGTIVLDTALALAAVEVVEGAGRELRWKRRRLKGIYPGR